MTSKAKKTGLVGAIGVLLMLQPAAVLSAYQANGVLTVEAATASATDEQLISQRGGRGGGGSRGGGSRGGGSRGGGSRSSGSRSSSRSSSGRTGFSSYSGSRQSTRQSTRSNRQTSRSSSSSNRQSSRSGTRDQRQTSRIDNRGTRQNTRSSNIDSRQQGRTSRTDQRQSGRNDRVNNRSKTRRDAVNNWDRYGSGWYSGSSWSNNRPWNNGWYGGSYYNNWRWYPGQAAAWGLAGMATFGTINSLVNSAQSNQVSYFEVPNSDYSLYYPSVTATGDVVSFEADNGYDTVRFNANCRNGTLNGGAPLNANEAQLLNAACQVAFGQ
ncbi:hypothetical protein [Synechococcus sp. MU1655]|uniref:hypothetical protein n=1 Tax=Synechococcus sp. MU1655 TaxID=2508355 RepID=UPI002025EA07|nr:hypothetical protein [Synechococcus sp. MU1655]